MVKRKRVLELYSDTDKVRLSTLSFKSRNSATDEPGRSPFRKDYGRLIHSAVFRRLQGKTQLFPGEESDFFRNRLTHSIEVAQIAKGIALTANSTHEFFKREPIDLDLVEVAGLAHDLGHPPFGHNGEEALDHCMKAAGGFEGNAQTLRILARLEKKVTTDPERLGFDRNTGRDLRLGLDLTFRTLASILKYDSEIPDVRDLRETVVKGYYGEERSIVQQIKRHVDNLGIAGREVKFKTIECSIMDVADDIAYSTYDLEDALKAGFLTPMSILTRASDLSLMSKVAGKVAKSLPPGSRFSAEDATGVLWSVFGRIFPKNVSDGSAGVSLADAIQAVRASGRVCENGYDRTELTTYLVKRFMSGVVIDISNSAPRFSTARLDDTTLLMVETLKHFTFETQIMSRRVRTAEYRGFDIVGEIFDALVSKKGRSLLPLDYRTQFDAVAGDSKLQKRIICDFVAGMTDRYAINFHARLFSNRTADFFKPF